MNESNIDRLLSTLLYEGYLVYPYRSSALKNKQRWLFGCVVPESYGAAHDGNEASTMQTECLVQDGGGTALAVEVRFLQPTETEAVERQVVVPEHLLNDLLERPLKHRFEFPGVGGMVEVSGARVGADLCKATVRIVNQTHLDRATQRSREEALRHSLVSTHTLLRVGGGRFLSLIDPPAELRSMVRNLRNHGTWPVLVGEPGTTAWMLSAPIILGDYPQLAPESPGDLFDASEIDELLTLRILTLTDRERQEIGRGDQRVRALLARTESLAEYEVAQLHGAVRRQQSAPFAPGDRVRLRPRGRADVFDLVLDGKIATVAAVEQDFDDRVFLAVTVDDDPGRDLGTQGKPGHRFFFRADEVESVE